MRMITLRRFAVVALALSASTVPLLRADVTLRYHGDFKTATFLPGTDRALQQMGLEQSIRMKGNRVYYTHAGFATILDLSNQELTLIDAAHKTFATIPASQFAEKMAAAMPKMPEGMDQQVLQIMSMFKVKAESKSTGRTNVIQGVQAEEREIVLSMEMPMPEGTPQSDPAVKMVMSVWTAKPEEARRVPAIRELTGFMLWQRLFMNPIDMLQKVFAKLPAQGDAIASLVKEMNQNASVILRTRIAMYAPMMAAVAEQMANQHGRPAPASVDPSAPLFQATEEIVELSTAALDDSIFQIPKDYSRAAVEDLVKTVVQVQKPTVPTPKP